MTAPWPRDMPLGGEPSGYGNHEHATWDAAYVLGALSAADRREFEAHMSGCPSCREAVGELSGMPALLSQIDCDQAAAIAADAPQVSQPRPEVLTSLLTRVRRQRRRSRLVTWLCAAAAAIGLTIGVFVGIGGHSVTSAPPQPSVSALPMAPVGTTRLTSTVSVSSRRWGTFIDLECVCLAPAHAHHDRLAMVVVGRDGTRTQLATWVAEPGHTARPAASISMPIDQIAAVQVVSVDNGNVLLHRSL